ncbi:MAG TPA: hypothetical protein VFU02_12705, partial [Polyangiaceae bacterium]|nr:hypothetical protein [Polyangiaceae bacterium]
VRLSTQAGASSTTGTRALTAEGRSFDTQGIVPFCDGIAVDFKAPGPEAKKARLESLMHCPSSGIPRAWSEGAC